MDFFRAIGSFARPTPFIIICSRGGGKKSLVEACTSFHVIPLDSWGTILSMYCLCRSEVFRDIINYAYKNCVIITSNAIVKMDYKALVRAIVLEHGYIVRSKLEEAILSFFTESRCLYFFIYWLWKVTVLLTASSHI